MNVEPKPQSIESSSCCRKELSDFITTLFFPLHYEYIQVFFLHTSQSNLINALIAFFLADSSSFFFKLYLLILILADSGILSDNYNWQQIQTFQCLSPCHLHKSKNKVLFYCTYFGTHDIQLEINCSMSHFINMF